MPGLTDIRSLSIFGLSDIKVYFQFGTDYFRDRQEVLNRLQLITLPQNVQPTISPWSAIAEIYRYEVEGAGKSLTDLKTIQEWQIRREFKRVPGVIDVTTFGGTAKEFHVDLDPGRLISYNVTLDQVMDALAKSNTDVGGNYLTMGSQSFNVRGMGLMKSLDDIVDTVVTEKEGLQSSCAIWDRRASGTGSASGKWASMTVTTWWKAWSCCNGENRRCPCWNEYTRRSRS